MTLILLLQIEGQAQLVSGKVFLKIKPEARTIHTELALSDFPSNVQPFGLNHIETAFQTASAQLQSIYLIHLEAGNELAFCDWASQLTWVEYAEPISYVYSHYVPDDYDSTRFHHLNIIRAVEAWDLEKGSEQVVIAIVDNGVLIEHNDLEANLWLNSAEIPGDSLDNDLNGFVDDIHGYDIGDDDGDPSIPHRAFRHGTHVAGCAAAVTDNGRGIASIGYSCRLMAVKVASDQGPTNVYTFDQALRGVDYAIHNGADIVNMSFGGTFFSLTGQLLMDIGHERGVIFVAATGNGPGDTNPATNDTTWEYPASFRHVISVTATDEQDRKAAIATHNSQVDLCAPGLQIRSTIPSASLGSSYGNLSGSSMSTAIVSGLLGLLLSHNACLSPDEAEAILKASCQPIDQKNPGLEGKLGSGRIDAFAALELVETQGFPSADFRVKDSIACDSLLQLIFLPDSLSACPEQWLWVLSDGQIDSSVNPVFRIDSSGLYEISLYVKQSVGSRFSEQTDLYPSS